MVLGASVALVYTAVSLTGTLPGQALVIDDGGLVGGVVQDKPDAVLRPFSWTAGTSLVRLPTRAPRNSWIDGVDARGELVGQTKLDARRTHAMLWRNGRVHDLGTLGGTDSFPGGVGSSAAPVNAAGQVVGMSDRRGNSTLAAFLWSNGRMRDLGTFGFGSCCATIAIDARGDVLVSDEQGGSGPFGTYLVRGGKVVKLPTLGGKSVRGEALNDAGEVAGESTTRAGHVHAFLWRERRMTDLGGRGVDVVALNASGTVLGTSGGQAVVWQNGTMTRLGTLGGKTTEPLAINDDGVVVGWSDTAAQQRHAFVWRDGVMTDLGTLGGAESGALAINAGGDVVGWAERRGAAYDEAAAALWTAPTP